MRKALLGSIAAVAAGAGLAAGQTPKSQPPAPVTYPSLNSQPFGTEHLGGDWGGVRPWLEGHGIYIGLNYYPEIAAIVAGGQRQGIDYTSQLGLSVDLDGEKLLGWTGFALHSVIVQRNGAAARAPISSPTTWMLCSRSLAGAAVSPHTWSTSMANSSSTTGGWTSRGVGCRWATSSRPRRSTATS